MRPPQRWQRLGTADRTSWCLSHLPEPLRAAPSTMTMTMTTTTLIMMMMVIMTMTMMMTMTTTVTMTMTMTMTIFYWSVPQKGS